MNLGILASGGGTNLQAIIDAERRGSLDAHIVAVISNNSKSGALERAGLAGIPQYHMSSATHGDDLDRAICDALVSSKTDYIVLAGYMKKIGRLTLGSFQNKIVNIHPSLLPKFGGKGMYGIKVHQAVVDAEERMSGVTVHLVNEHYDEGPVLSQRTVTVERSDTAETLQDRILETEHELYVDTLNRIANGEIKIQESPSFHIIRPVETEIDLARSVEVIRESFKPVAVEMNLTEKNCPTHPGFVTLDTLKAMRLRKTVFFGLWTDMGGNMVRQIGFAALEQAQDNPGTCFIEKLAVIPGLQHRGFGGILLEFLCEAAQKSGAERVSVALIDQAAILKGWYRKHKFTVSGTKKFDHLPFTVCFMDRYFSNSKKKAEC